MSTVPVGTPVLPGPGQQPPHGSAPPGTLVPATGQPVGLGDGVTVGVTLGLGEGVGLVVGLGLGVTVGVTDGLGLGLSVGVGVALGEGGAVGDPDGLTGTQSWLKPSPLATTTHW